MLTKERKFECALREIHNKVAEQSNNEEIWEKTATVKALQKQLRALHDTVEHFTIPLFERFSIVDSDTLKEWNTSNT